MSSCVRGDTDKRSLPVVGRTERGAVERIVMHVRLCRNAGSLRTMRMRSHRSSWSGSAHSRSPLGLHTSWSHHSTRSHVRSGLMGWANHVGAWMMRMWWGSTSTGSPWAHMSGMRSMRRTGHHCMRGHRMGTRRCAVEMGTGSTAGSSTRTDRSTDVGTTRNAVWGRWAPVSRGSSWLGRG